MAYKEVETWETVPPGIPNEKYSQMSGTWPGSALKTGCIVSHRETDGQWQHCLALPVRLRQHGGGFRTTADTRKGAILRLPIRPAAEGLYRQGIRQAHRDRLCREKAEKDGSLCCDHYLLAVPLRMRQGDHCRSA